MSSLTAVQLFEGTYRAQPTASTFAFGVRHSGAFWFRGSFADVTATLRGDGDALVLEGAARVESISIVDPPEMRASVLGDQFFDAERHPEVGFRSTAIRLADDGGAEVDGELTIRGVTRPVAAVGHLSPPRQAGFGEVAGVDLQATIDRRDFGFDWQAELPDGGDAVGWEVEVNIDLLLLKDDGGR
ncbi:MAG TPA: YceI family protein [Solirubrobacterales bacterium]|nr:YceI family protein [Solirubrobacterales bacterium]